MQASQKYDLPHFSQGYAKHTHSKYWQYISLTHCTKPFKQMK